MKNHVEWPSCIQAFQQVIVHGSLPACSNLSFRQYSRQSGSYFASTEQNTLSCTGKKYLRRTVSANGFIPAFRLTKNLKTFGKQSLLQPHLSTFAKNGFHNIFHTGLSCLQNCCKSIQFKT